MQVLQPGKNAMKALEKKLHFGNMFGEFHHFSTRRVHPAASIHKYRTQHRHVSSYMCAAPSKQNQCKTATFPSQVLHMHRNMSSLPRLNFPDGMLAGKVNLRHSNAAVDFDSQGRPPS